MAIKWKNMESVSVKSPRLVDLTKFDGTNVNKTWHKLTAGENSAQPFKTIKFLF